MKLDRNIDGGHGNKYGLVKKRGLEELRKRSRNIGDAIDLLVRAGVIDWGDTPETEFFLIRLKDKYAASGLAGYAEAARDDDPEYAYEIVEMAGRAGPANPHCKRPD